MGMERDSNSVLAKLMGIERPSLPNKSHGRPKVLSENYLQNIALVTHRKRSSLHFYEDSDEFSMSVESDTAQLQTRAKECNNMIDWCNDVRSSVNGGNAIASTNSEAARFVPHDQRSEQFGGFDLRSNTSSWSELGCVSNMGSSHASAVKKQKLSNSWIWQAKSQQNVKNIGFAHNVSKDCLEPDNSKPPLPGRSVSIPSSPSSGRRLSSSSCARNKGNHARKTESLYNGVESRTQNLMPAQGVAKQVTSQMNQSIWHFFMNVSESGHSNGTSCANEIGETMSSSSCLSSLDNEHDTSAAKPIEKSASQGAWKTKKDFSEKWTIRSTIGPRTYCGNSNPSELNSWQVHAARYLSKPTLYPSAWVPRSRARDLDLKRYMCLRPEKRHSLQYDYSVEKDSGHEVLRSALKPSANGEAQRILEDSEKLKDSNILEEVSSALESFSESSTLSDVETPTYHEAFMTLSETDDQHSANHVSEEWRFGSALKFSVDSTSMDNGEIIDRGNEIMDVCTKLQREHLPADSEVCILLEDRGSNFPEFCLKHQVKENSSEPGSPVSSLEGPEAGQCRQKLIVECNQISSNPDILGNIIHGIRTKLQPIDTVSLESISEGPEMALSSDGDNEAGSVGCYREDAQIVELYCTSENRDFSYIVDVLSELGFPTLNLETESETWRCRGYALNPFVFDSLEKKYGKQTFWDKSERKLLFDRMNLGLMEIARSMDPMNTWKRPLAKRLLSTESRDLIEEELWSWLMKQEEQAKWESSNKVCGGEREWLELEAYTYLIVKEVESSLLDEFVEEIVTDF